MEHGVKPAAEIVEKARGKERPSAEEYIRFFAEDFLPLAGDRTGGEDPAVIGGIGRFFGMPVTLIGTRKGKDLSENLTMRFGMPEPAGYRKAERLMRQAAKFGRPVITIVDTPGAYPGKEAEEQGQGQVIASCIRTMCRLPVPTAVLFTGEGGSGGALALAAADRVIMMENSIFSVLSPEGFASILWHDGGRWREACEVMKLTPKDLKEFGICDEIVQEEDFRDPEGKKRNLESAKYALRRELAPLLSLSKEELLKRRYKRLRNVGNFHGRNQD